MKVFNKSLLLIVPLLLCSCASIELTGPLRAVVSGITALVQSQDDANNCTQGHVQDRLDCRNKKASDVEAISKSIKRNSEGTETIQQDYLIEHFESPEPQEFVQLEEYEDPEEFDNDHQALEQKTPEYDNSSLPNPVRSVSKDSKTADKDIVNTESEGQSEQTKSDQLL